MSEPLVSLVIPALDEEADIAGCIAALAAQDYPLASMELIVVDGGSSDDTVGVALGTAEGRGFAGVRIVPSPRRRTSISLNLGLGEAAGEYLVRVDARARVPADYVRRCVEVLRSDPAVGVVGGAQRPVPRSQRIVDRGIARALDNRLATGLSRYRRSTRSGAADTVWMGSFRTSELRRLGGWCDEVALNEDWELNRRYRDSGALVWFVGEMASAYLPRASYGGLARQYFAFGRVKGMWWVREPRPELRQVALVGLPVVGLGLLASLVRRFGPGTGIVVPVGLMAVERVGSSGPCGVVERGAAGAAIAVFTGAWWVGVVVGAAGEVAGVEHRHRTAPG